MMNQQVDKITVSTQFNKAQLHLLVQIMIAENLKPSKAEILRQAFEFYASEKYPQLCEREV